MTPGRLRVLLACGLVGLGARAGAAEPAAPPTPAAAAAVAGAPPGEGSKYLLDGIAIEGNGRTRDRVILRYVPFRRGDVIDVDDPLFTLTRYRLLGTGFFREVELSLRKGRDRGHVVLVVEVEERNTLVVNDLWMGLGADADADGDARPLTAFAGVDGSEGNLGGTGIALGAAAAIASDQFALRVRLFDPAFLGSSVMTHASLLYNHASDFFGNRLTYFDDPTSAGTTRARSAVVEYDRSGGTLGFGHDLSVTTQLWASYRLEAIDADLPRAASHVRGTRGELDREPIDFSIIRGQSVLSTLSATLQHDTRDKPLLPTRGVLTAVTTEVSLAPLGSAYAYSRLDGSVSRYTPLPWHGHVLRLRAFAGAIAGRAPFFDRYYVGDLSDFRAPRVLGLNVERRPAPNFLGTSVIETRFGDYAAKVDAEYRIPLYRGSRSVFGIDLFARFGAFAIAGRRDLLRPPGGYSGLALLPVDLTANLGVQMDTSAGGFSFALANAIGFLPALSEAP